jgi:hypothetical protein
VTVVGLRDGNPFQGQEATLELADRWDTTVGSALVHTDAQGAATSEFTVTQGGTYTATLIVDHLEAATATVLVLESIAEPIEMIDLSLTPITPVDSDSAVDYLVRAVVTVCGFPAPQSEVHFGVPAPATSVELPRGQDGVAQLYLRSEQQATLQLSAASSLFGSATATARFGVAPPIITSATEQGIFGEVSQEVDQVTLVLPPGSVPETATAEVVGCRTEGTDLPSVVCDWRWPATGNVPTGVSSGEFSAIAVDVEQNQSALVIDALSLGAITPPAGGKGPQVHTGGVPAAADSPLAGWLALIGAAGLAAAFGSLARRRATAAGGPRR